MLEDSTEVRGIECGGVSTVGLDEATVIESIRNQEAEEERHEQLRLGMPL